MFFNSKGQAFDVFKLLIAAVIALAMLAILVPILQNITDFSLSSIPNEKASNLVKNNLSVPSAYVESSEVTFSNQNRSLNAKAIAAQSSGISSRQICISKGDFKDSGEFQFDESSTDNIILNYSGSSQKAKIGAVCDDAKSLQANAENYTGGAEFQCIDGKNSLPDSSQTYCLLVLKYV